MTKGPLQMGTQVCNGARSALSSAKSNPSKLGTIATGKFTWLASLSLAAIFSSESLYAAGGLPHFVNYYEWILSGQGIDLKYMPVLSSLFVLGLLFILGTVFSSYAKAAVANQGGGSGRFSLGLLVEMIMEFLYSLTKDQCGERFRSFLTLMSTIFLFILICNLTGLVPGFPPATEVMSTNVAIGLVTFIVYNSAGFKEHGIGYLKQFAGPVLFIAPLFFCIELFSHFSRPLSLGLRLTGNIFGDHLLLGVFTGLVPAFVPVPAILMFFGLLVASVQAFVFTLLTGIYISMAISHDH